MDASHFFADLSRLESLLGLPEGFLERLIEEDDWSFVIKSHAVIEAALTNLITSSTDPRLATMFRKANIDGRFGKVEIAKALGVLNPSTLNLIKKLSTLRNDFIHDIKYLSLDLHSYFEAMESQYRHALSKLISQVVTCSDEEGLFMLAEQGLSDEPKLTLALATLAILAQTLFKIDPNEYTRAREKLKDATKDATPFILFATFVLVVIAASQDKDNPFTGIMK